MTESVEQYLAQLKAHLAGGDPATIQDALADAEEHLRTALSNEIALHPGMSESQVLSLIVERYGSPDEISAAYQEIEARIRPALAQRWGSNRSSFIGRYFSVLSDSRAWGACLYMLISIVTGMIYFTWAVSGLSLSLGLLVLIIGMPFLGIFLLSVRSIALVEGRVVEALLGVRMPRRPFFTDPSTSWWDRSKSLLLDPRTWGAIGYMFISLPLGVVYFSMIVILGALSLSFVAAPITVLAFDLPMTWLNGAPYYPPDWLLPLVVFVGIILLPGTMHLAKLVGRMHGALVKALLVGS